MFQPILGNGEKLKIPWQLFMYKISCCWPVKYGANQLYVVGKKLILSVLLVSFIITVYAEFSFIFENKSDISLVTECLCTTLAGVEFFIRVIMLNLRSNTMRKVLDEFYRKIFLLREEDEQQEKKLRKNLIPTIILSYSYITPATIILCGPIILVLLDPYSRNKPYLYRMRFLYDAQDPIAYGITTLYTFWVGLSCVSLMISEDYIISVMLCHCASRYEMLHSKLKSLFSTSVSAATNIDSESQSDVSMEHKIYKNFINGFTNIVKNHQELDEFSKDLEHFYTITLFIIITVDTFLLCVIAFQLATFGVNTGTIQYITWLLSTGIELFVLGNSGQKLSNASDKLSDMYFMSNWEDLLPMGTKKMNSALMKDVSFAIFRSQRPVELTGLNFMKLSLISIERAMSTSMSYFMFLITMTGRK